MNQAAAAMSNMSKFSIISSEHITATFDIYILIIKGTCAPLKMYAIIDKKY